MTFRNDDFKRLNAIVPDEVEHPEALGFEFDFFLSFSGNDERLALRAYDLLTSFGYKVCMEDVNFSIGKSFLSEMDRAYLSSRKVIALLTPRYFATSPHTRREFDAAVIDEKLIIFRFQAAGVPPSANALIRQDFPDELTSAKSLELLRNAARLQPKRTTKTVQRINLKSLPRWQGGNENQHRLIGRDAELAKLHAALESHEIAIVCVIADGGFGKSSLVRRWLDDLSRTDFAGIDAAFAYSFYKQGWSGSSAAVTRSFFVECLCALTDREESDFDEVGEDVLQREILRVLRTNRVLLVLDGLEPNQNPANHRDAGVVISSVLKDFLDRVKEMGASGGLCVVTSRIMPPNLVCSPGSEKTQQITLAALDLATSVEALVAAGLANTNPNLIAWAEKSEGHPLLIALLAPAIQSGHYDPEMFRADQVLTERHTKNIPATVQNVVATRLEQLGAKAKAVLYCVALFDRAVTYGELKQDVLDRAIIPLFTEELRDGKDKHSGSSEKFFREGLEALSKAAMLSCEGSDRKPDSLLLEAHPVVQAGVRCEIEAKCAAMWRRANWTVYTSITRSIKDRAPDDMKSLRRLYQAVPHGVHAGKGKAAGWMYAKRCLRGFRAYSTNRGMVADDVALMANYFEGNWTRLREDIGLNSFAKIQAYVWAGALLTAVNRAHEGVDLMERGLTEARLTRNFTTAARTARILGVLSAMRGDLARGEDLIRESIADLDKRSALLSQFIDWKFVDRDFQRMASHTMLASILHEQGRFQEAERSFLQAESIQRKATRFSGLRNIWCYRKVDFLYDTERFDEARRALAAASIEPEEPKGWGEGVFVDVILQLARIRGAIREADLLATAPDPEILNDGEIALKRLEQDQGYRMDWLLPVAKIAIAGKARLTHAFARATISLTEAEDLISKSGNILFRVDLLMERTRLNLACSQFNEAREVLKEASELATRLRYLCRSAEIAKLRAMCQHDVLGTWA